MNERQQSILSILVNSNDFLPASYFSKKLNVSSKTVYKDLSVIEEELIVDHLTILRKPSVGIKIVGGQKNLKNLKLKLSENTIENNTFSPLHRRMELVRILFLLGESVTLEDMSRKFFVSKASIYKDIDYINNILPGDVVIINSDVNGLNEIGNENFIQTNIKQVIEYFLYREGRTDLFYERLNIFFKKELIDSVQSVVERYTSDLEGDVPTHYKNSLSVLLLVLCQRLIVKKYIIQEDEFLFNTVKFMETYVVASEILKELSFRTGIIFSSYDNEYISKQLFAHRMGVEIFSQEYIEYESDVKELINRMNMIHKTDLEKNKRLLKSLNSHIPAMILRLKKNIRIVNPLLEDIKSQYSELFSMVGYALTSIEKKYNVLINDDEISLVLIHFQIALDAQYESNNILIVCQYGVSSAEFIYNKVRKFLPAYDNIEVSTTEKFYKSSKNNIDLIISSIDLDVQKIPYVKVNPLVKKDDYVKIMQAYTQHIIQKKDSVKGELIEKSSVLNKYTKDEMIFLNSQYDRKNEVLDMIISKIEKLDYVKKEFRESVFNREEIGDTNIESQVALPHGDPATIKKSHIIYMTLNKPINWGSTNVKLVIMVNLCEDDISEVREVVSELYKRIDSNEKVKKICKSNNIKEFRENMFYEEEL